MNLTPLRSIQHYSIGEQDAPLPYMTNVWGPLAHLQGELHWHMIDLCFAHRAIYSQMNEQLAELNDRYDMRAKMLADAKAKSTLDDDDEEAFAVAESRLNDNYIAHDMHLTRVRHFADEFTVVALWATAEQYMSRGFAALEGYLTGCPADTVDSPYKWDDFEAEFAGRKIVLASLHDYQHANECRVLNNAIKHSPIVKGRLMQFSYFAPLAGQPLVKVEFQMQRYHNGVWHFLGSLFEACNRLMDPTFPY